MGFITDKYILFYVKIYGVNIEEFALSIFYFIQKNIFCTLKFFRFYIKDEIKHYNIF